jgi:hypothetical protein
MFVSWLLECIVLWVICLHLADELTTESVDDTSDGRLLALANEVEVKHTLDGLGLHSAMRLLGLFLVEYLARRSWSFACFQLRPRETY